MNKLITNFEYFVENNSKTPAVETKIISAFPGTGKTTYFNKHRDECIDSDSSEYSWIIDKDGTKTRNPDFPNNYIKAIKENIGKYEFIFVSSHEDVRKLLLDNNLFFYLFYPAIERKEEFIERYKSRGSDEKFIALLENKWNEWIGSIDVLEEDCFKKIKLDSEINMSDILPTL